MSESTGGDEGSLREQICSLVSEYYTRFDRLANLQFEPGKTFIQCAGRVYSQTEMKLAVEAALDFQLTSGRFATGFEKGLSKWLGSRHTVLVNSGSSANLVAFYSITSDLVGDRKVNPGDEIITVATGFPTTVAPMIQYGAVPVFLDVLVEDGTYDIDTNALEEALSPRTKGVMLAHTLGNPFDLKTVSDFCKRHNLWLIEDNCDALGSKYDGKLTGTFGDLATLSFYPAHHITTGEGGAVFMQKPILKRVAESFRDWGRDCWCEPGKDNTCGKRFGWQLGNLPECYDHKYTYRHFGFNLKMTEFQAAIGLGQLEKLESFIELRKKNWGILREGLKDLEDYFILPAPTPNSEPSWFGFVLTVRKNAGFSRTEIVNYLESKKIQTRALFAGNMIRHPMFDNMRSLEQGYRVVGELKGADTVLTDTFWIGVYPGLSEAMVYYMVDCIVEFVKGE